MAIVVRSIDKEMVWGRFLGKLESGRLMAIVSRAEGGSDGFWADVGGGL
jgi:hypothetical protein